LLHFLSAGKTAVRKIANTAKERGKSIKITNDKRQKHKINAAADDDDDNSNNN
jgi:hypothetical protein